MAKIASKWTLRLQTPLSTRLSRNRSLLPISALKAWAFNLFILLNPKLYSQYDDPIVHLHAENFRSSSESIHASLWSAKTLSFNRESPLGAPLTTICPASIQEFPSQICTFLSIKCLAFVSPLINHNNSSRIPFQYIFLVVNNGKPSDKSQDKVFENLESFLPIYFRPVSLLVMR